MMQAHESVNRVRETADAVVVISNSNVLEMIPDDTSLEASFGLVDEVMGQAVFGLSNMITKTGILTAGFGDVNSVLQNSGLSVIGIGNGFGESASEDATTSSLNSPLFDTPLHGARGILVNIVGGESLRTKHIDTVLQTTYANVNKDANVKAAAQVDNSFLSDAVFVTVLCSQDSNH
jgi:cell division protein FtsZ